MGLHDYSSRPRATKGALGAFLQLILDIVMFVLMLLGVVGILHRFLMPEGWLSKLWDFIWKQNPAYSFLLLAAVIGIFLVGKNWLDALNIKGKPGNLIAYAWMGLGVYFGFRILTTGSL